MLYVYSRPTLNIKDYTECKATQLSEKQLNVFYNSLENFQQGQYVVEYDLSESELFQVLDELNLYFGTVDGYLAASYSKEKIYFNQEKIEQAERDRRIINARIDEALSTLPDAKSDRVLLYEIAEYISRKIEYDNTDSSNTIDALNGDGVCRHYAILFYKMARRIGYECYICYGYADGIYHAWNQVIINGQSYFYDVTFYDSNRTPEYLHSKNSWEREYSIFREY